jgi:hypothetical protein
MSVPKIVMPLCSECRRVSVLDPCRFCASKPSNDFEDDFEGAAVVLPLAPYPNSKTQTKADE